MEYLAHSAKEGLEAQTYEDHITGVMRRAVDYASEASQYSTVESCTLVETACQCAIWHDLGKLDDQNQAVLRGIVKGKHLPINHVDAGCAELLKNGQLYAALAVYAHHRGLPDFPKEYACEDSFFRDKSLAVRKHVDETLENMVCRHRQIKKQGDDGKPSLLYEGDQGVYFRMLLSCLADADHEDTAAYYGNCPGCEDVPKLKANERLSALDRYVFGLAGDDERSRLRREMYDTCKESAYDANEFAICDSPVGSGKTTAVMAYMLRRAVRKNARRVFVVLPYTSIIQQSVEVYRKALTLPGENPEAVVAELHCRADFQSPDVRYLTALWRAPIVVTTAVAFFETLASNRPSALRKLHELPGSIVFVDESHNALPLKLLPLAWHWMNVLAEEWSCEWILASGSLVQFWKLDALKEYNLPQPKVSPMVDDSVREKLMQYEQRRVTFQWKSCPISREELLNWLADEPGPRLLIVNTVQSAAVLANDLCRQFGREKVEHLSTALTPKDRDAVIKRIKIRLDDSQDTDWTLVATSCVEAGVDFSFRTGFRELSSLLSLLQASGRVNRHGYYNDAQMWSFYFQDDTQLRANPSLKSSREALQSYFEKNIEISPELSTRSIRDELIRNDSCIEQIRKLKKNEDSYSFQTIANDFRVIDSDTATVVIDGDLAKEIAYGHGEWRQVQRLSVAIRRNRLKQWNVREIYPEIYQWTLRYDDFLGYMRGVLDTMQSFML